MKINKILSLSESNGPGKRFTIWVQGCSIRCTGCINKDTWDSLAGEEQSIENLYKSILESNFGLTITGGEPLDQYNDTLCLCKKVFPVTDVFLTSGYTLETIQKKYPEILSYIDILVSGPFQENNYSDSLLWKGSTNQNVSFLTARAIKIANNDLKRIKAEIIIDKKTGMMLVTGFSIPKAIL